MREINNMTFDEAIEEGRASIDSEDYSAAIDLFTRAIELQSEYASAHYHRGLAHYNLDEPNEALQDLTRAVELDPSYAARAQPGNALAFFNRAVAYHDLGHFDEVVKDLTQVIDLDPNNELAKHLLEETIKELNLKQQESACLKEK